MSFSFHARHIYRFRSLWRRLIFLHLNLIYCFLCCCCFSFSVHIFLYLIKICRRWHKSILFELMFFLYTRTHVLCVSYFSVCLRAPIKQNTDKIVIKTITIVWIYGFDGFIVPLFLSKNAVTNRPKQVWSIQMISVCALGNQPLHHSNRHDWLEN